MVAARHLDYLVETIMVELASFLLLDPVSGHDTLAIMMPPAVLLALYSSIVVPSLIHGFGLSLALMFVEDCTDGLLTRGVPCYEVEQFPRHPQLAASEFVNECFVGHTRDECSDHVRIHDVKKLIALLGKAMDVLT